MYQDLQAFIAALDAAGELKRIAAEVSPILEITEVTDRVSKSPAARPSATAPSFDPDHHDAGGHALLFERVAGSTMPVGINLFGSYRRMEMALGCEQGGFPGLAEKVAQLTKPEPPTSLMEKLKKIPELAKIASFPPRLVSRGICQEVVRQGEEINLLELPVLKCWPDDGDPAAFGLPVPEDWSAAMGGEPGTTPGANPGQGRYITLAGVYTIHPDDAGKPDGEPRPTRNIGMYRVQLIDERRTAMHWHMHHDGARHWRAWKKRGKPMPVALAFGGESVLPYAATAPLPPGVSELLFAGFLNGGGIPLVRCKTVDLHVPAHAEMIIEGHVSTECGYPGWDPRPPAPGLAPEPIGPGAFFEGPFGDHTGFYSLPDRYPIFEVSAVTHRRSPVYPTTIVGLPPQEDYYMGKATERIFLPLLQTLVPDIIDYHLPMFGVFHNCAFIKIRKEYPLQARRVMHAIWGAGQMAWTKVIVVVDDHVNVHDESEVWFQVCSNFDPGRDLEIVNGPVDILDHAAPRLGAGHKIGFDATAKVKGEEVGGHAVRDWPRLIEMTGSIRERVSQRWSEYGLG